MNRQRVVTVVLLGCALLPATPAYAAPVSVIDRDAEQKTLVDRLVLDRATTLATAEKRAFDRERSLLAQLDERDKQLRRSLAQRKQSEADAASTRAELLHVTAERERLVADIATRDATYRAELGEYRRIIASLASAPSEDRRQALERYADGDRFGAFLVLEAQTRAEEAAREKANKLKAAEDYRQLAALATDMKDRGEKTTDEVLRLWQAASERDPGDLWTWIFLARLHQEAGQTDKAGDAAARALHAANQPRDRSAALNTLGNVQVAAGDLAAARKSFEDSHQTLTRLAAANPGSAQAQRDVSVSLDKLGDVQVAAGDLAAARKSFEDGHQIRTRLAAANPGSAEAQRDVSVSLNRLGDVQVAAGDLAAARKRFEDSLQIARRLAAANPASAEAQRDVSVSLNKLGNVQVAAGELAAARKSFEEDLQIARRLAAANPGSAQAQRDVSVSLNKLGDVQVAAGDLAAARTRFEDSHQTLTRLATANPGSAEAQRDVSVSLDRLGDVQVAAGDLAAARKSFEDSHQIRTQLAAANPSSTQAQRDVSVSLNKLGDVQVAAGDLAAARKSFEDSLQIARRLAAANPASAEAQRDVSVSLNKLGNVQVAAGELAAARRSFEEDLQIARRLAAANPGSAQAQRDVSVSLNKLGNVQAAAGELAAARKRFEEDLQIARRLAAANPGSAEAQRDVSVSLEKLGNVQVAAGDLAAARKNFEDSHQIRTRLAAANPGSAEAQRDVAVSLWRLAQLPGGGVRWREVTDVPGVQWKLVASLRPPTQVCRGSPAPRRGGKMTECFVSYKREDEARVRRVVQGLREAGLNVWWDQDIPGGGPWRETIVEHLDAARCVVVCWTQASTGPDGAYVREEAERAKARGALLPVLLDPVSPPFGFGEVQALNLQGWQGGGKDAQWVHLVATVRAFVSGQPPPKPPKPAIWRWSAISAGAGAFALMVGFINDVQGLQSSLCRADSMRGLCRSLGLGGVPSPEEEKAWTAAQQREDGNGYRDYLRTYPQGAYAQAALARLAACRPIAETHWQAREDALPLFVKPDLAPTPTESAARERTLPELRTAAATACGFVAKTDTHRLRGVRVDEAGWRCEPSPAGWRCHYDGTVVCELDVRSTTQREVCGDPGQAASAQASGNPR